MFFTSSSCCCRNSWRSSSASYSESASGLTGPISRSSRSSSRARAGSVVPPGTSGGSAATATSGSQSCSWRTCSIACSSRNRISASSISRRLARSRCSASCRSASARSVRSVSRRRPALARGLRLETPSRAQPVGQVLDLAARARRVVAASSAIAAATLFEAPAVRAGLCLLVGPRREALLDFRETRPQYRASLFDRGAAHVERSPQRRRLLAHPFVLVTPRTCVGADLLGLGKHLARGNFGVGNRGELAFALGDTPRECRASFVERRSFHLDRAPQLGGARDQRLEVGTPPTLVLSGDELGAARGRETLTCVFYLGGGYVPVRVRRRRLGRTRPRARPGVTADEPGGPARQGADATEPIAFSRDRDDAGIRERDVERLLPAVVDQDERCEQAREDRIETFAEAADTRTQRTRLWRRERDLHAACTTLRDEHQRLAVAPLQAFDRDAGGRVAVDNDRFRARRRARRQPLLRCRRRCRADRRAVRAHLRGRRDVRRRRPRVLLRARPRAFLPGRDIGRHWLRPRAT